MPFFVDCPHCGQKTSISESMLGQSVQCPHCSRCFHVAIQVDAPLAERIQVPWEPSAPSVFSEPANVDIASRTEARSRMLGPAIGLIVTGAGNTLAGLLFLPALLFPEMVGQPGPLDPLDFVLSLIFMLIALALGIVTIYGAIKALNLEDYKLAMTAAIAAMIPCYCCFLGLPFGIWALVMLRDPAVKLAFQKRRRNHR